LTGVISSVADTEMVTRLVWS